MLTVSNFSMLLIFDINDIRRRKVFKLVMSSSDTDKVGVAPNVTFSSVTRPSASIPYIYIT